MKINPTPTQFIIFSGGGGLIEREQKVKLVPGLNQFEIENVPAAFDPSTTMISLTDNSGVTLQQVDVKRPDKNIVDNFINREKQAAQNIIHNATDLRGESRDLILQIIESANYRKYEDMAGTIIVSIDSKSEVEIELKVKYFIEDSRLKWEPSLHVVIDEETGKATLEGYILIMNNTDINYPQCELGFAEFETQGEAPYDGYLNDLESEQVAQNVMPSNRMMKKMKNVSNFFM